MTSRNICLKAEIEKNFPGFSLRAKFEMKDGVFSLFGASGSGKSLILRCIAGIEAPDAGRIELNGRTLFDSEKRINLPARKRNVGYLFQNYALFANMSVLGNIICACKNREKAQYWAEKFCLKDQMNLYPRQLSGGQQQRAAIARMLAANPELVMLDEPFSALDQHLKMRLERIIFGMNEDFAKPIIFVSHDRDEVYRLSHEIAVVENGCVLAVKTKEDLFREPINLSTALLTGCKNFSKVAAAEDGTAELCDWGIRTALPVGMRIIPKFAGLRAHDILLGSDEPEMLKIRCRIARVVKNPFSLSVMCRPLGLTNADENSYIVAETLISKVLPSPGDDTVLSFDPRKLIFLEN